MLLSLNHQNTEKKQGKKKQLSIYARNIYTCTATYVMGHS